MLSKYQEKVREESHDKSPGVCWIVVFDPLPKWIPRKWDSDDTKRVDFLFLTNCTPFSFFCRYCCCCRTPYFPAFARGRICEVCCRLLEGGGRRDYFWLEKGQRMEAAHNSPHLLDESSSKESKSAERKFFSCVSHNLCLWILLYKIRRANVKVEVLSDKSIHKKDTMTKMMIKWMNEKQRGKEEKRMERERKNYLKGVGR